MTVDSPRSTLSQLTVLDWIGTSLACLGTLACLQFPFFVAPAYKGMFADFGGPLPTATGLVLSLWFPLLVGLAPLVLLVLGLATNVALSTRRILIVASFLVSLGDFGFLVISLYLPLFEIARAIQ